MRIFVSVCMLHKKYYTLFKFFPSSAAKEDYCRYISKNFMWKSVHWYGFGVVVQYILFFAIVNILMLKIFVHHSISFLLRECPVFFGMCVSFISTFINVCENLNDQYFRLKNVPINISKRSIFVFEISYGQVHWLSNMQLIYYYRLPFMRSIKFLSRQTFLLTFAAALMCECTCIFLCQVFFPNYTI